MPPIVLIHGGVWEPMDADRFWVRPGIVDALRDHGADVHAPDRLPRAPSWHAEAWHLAPLLPDEPFVLIAGSNGCSVALALLGLSSVQAAVAAMVLAWPATAGDRGVDDRLRAGLAATGADPGLIDGLLTGGPLRGVSTLELSAVRVPTAVLPSSPENPVHQRRTVDALLGAIPGAVELPGCPEPPHPAFPAHRDAFVTAVVGFSESVR